MEGDMSPYATFGFGRHDSDLSQWSGVPQLKHECRRRGESVVIRNENERFTHRCPHVIEENRRGRRDDAAVLSG